MAGGTQGDVGDELGGKDLFGGDGEGELGEGVVAGRRVVELEEGSPGE